MYFDIFISHAWRYHDDWINFSKLLDSDNEQKWRNFSLPWHDPAINLNSELGSKFIRENLENQIIPVDCVVVLSSVYSIQSARKWVDMELFFAKKHKKLIIGAPNFSDNNFSHEMLNFCHATCDLNVVSLKNEINKYFTCK